MNDMNNDPRMIEWRTQYNLTVDAANAMLPAVERLLDRAGMPPRDASGQIIMWEGANDYVKAIILDTMRYVSCEMYGHDDSADYRDDAYTLISNLDDFDNRDEYLPWILNIAQTTIDEDDDDRLNNPPNNVGITYLQDCTSPLVFGNRPETFTHV